MLELKYPEKIIMEKYGITVRPYLLPTEVALIIGELIEKETYVDKEIRLHALLLHFCTDLTKEETSNEEVYYTLYANGFFAELCEMIPQVGTVYKGVKDAESMDRVFNKFLDKLGTSITNLEKKLTTKTLGKQIEKAIVALQGAVKSGDNKRS